MSHLYRLYQKLTGSLQRHWRLINSLVLIATSVVHGSLERDNRPVHYKKGTWLQWWSCQVVRGPLVPKSLSLIHDDMAASSAFPHCAHCLAHLPTTSPCPKWEISSHQTPLFARSFLAQNLTVFFCGISTREANGPLQDTAVFFVSLSGFLHASMHHNSPRNFNKHMYPTLVINLEGEATNLQSPTNKYST